MATTFVGAACHCNLNTFKVAFLTTSLPISTDLCHCNTCRHNTGQMFVHGATIHGDPLSVDAETHTIADLQHLMVYNVSKSFKRYFCSKCCAYMFSRDLFQDGHSRWHVSTGVLERVVGILEVKYHSFLKDTHDGGIADQFREVNGISLPRYNLSSHDEETLPLGWKSDLLLQTQKVHPITDSSTLSAYCYCRSIDLSFTRVTEITDPEIERWLVPNTAKHPSIRYTGLHCACNSCRLTSGSLIESWVYLPRANIINARTSLPVILNPKDGESKMEGLLTYESSPGVFREYCGKCGAAIFYWKYLREADVLDVAAGLIDEEQEGARAERWFGWAPRVGYAEDALDKAGCSALEAGLSIWNRD